MSEIVKFFTLGCKVNQYETQLLREQFLRAGFKEAGNEKPGDVYLVNTCTVTHRADADSLAAIRKAYKENPKARIIVTGCLAESDGGKIKGIKGVRGVFKNSEKEDIVHSFISSDSTIKRLPAGKAGLDDSTKGISFFKDHTRAFLKIQDGCDNFCSYCKVPLVRGRQKSRPLGEITKEAEDLVRNGFKEIVLTGICLGSYGKDRSHHGSLIEVIDSLEHIRGLLRIRLSSIEANEVTQELINRLSVSKKLCHHLHIPLQSGDDAILRKMNRHYTRKDYLNLIRRIRSKITGAGITTDCLAGFPGETEDNFNNTIKAIENIAPLKVHIFPYSLRSGTSASMLPEQLSRSIIKTRVCRLKKIADDCSLEYRNKFLGRVMPVLAETRIAPDSCLWEGYTDNYIRVKFASRVGINNSIVMVKLEAIEDEYMRGRKV